MATASLLSSSNRFLLPILLSIPTQVVLSNIEEVPTIPILAAYTITNVSVLTYQLTTSTGTTASEIVLNLTGFNAVFLTCFILLTLVRRVYLHPLCKFPGQKRAAATRLWEAWLNSEGINGPHARELHRLHKTPILRTGPNELSVSSVEALGPLYNRNLAQRTRGPFYTISKFLGATNVLTTRNNAEHRVWRGLWDRAFTLPNMEGYTAKVEQHVDRFMHVIKREVQGEDGKKPKELNFTGLSDRFAFDVMAELGFGRPDFGMLTGKGDPTYMNTLHRYMRVIAMVSSLRNLLDIAPYLPLPKDTLDFRQRAWDLLQERLAMKDVPRDVSTAFLEKDPLTGAKFTRDQLQSNVELLMVAGSDTTSTVLTNAILELSRHQDLQAKLYAEIKALVDSGKEITPATTKGLPYLNAVINETMRLWPAVPSGAQALVGPQGLQVEGQFIPPRTVVRVFQYVLHTDERYWVRPDEYIPERWTDEKPELIIDRRAFIPFSYGQHSCVGKNLALAELRLALSRTIYNFHVSLGPSFDDATYRKEWKDYFTSKCGDCWIKVEERK